LTQQDDGTGRVKRRARDNALAVLENPLEVGSQQRLDDPFLRAEVLVDRRDAHVGGRGNLLERRTRVALQVEQLRCGGEHGLARAQVSGVSADRSRTAAGCRAHGGSRLAHVARDARCRLARVKRPQHLAVGAREVDEKTVIERVVAVLIGMAVALQ
jgi:hypothetical protein